RCIHERSSALWRAIKKNDGSQNEFGSGQRNHELVAHYEQLRTDALSAAPSRSTGPALALFLRKGMTAWMRAWSPCMQHAAAEVAPPPATAPSCPQDLRA